ncbi:MAG: OsmC family protein [Gammaproteobacteria bacterium]|nr:OsmC family protein [Gammaproteobacteria bacterium]
MATRKFQFRVTGRYESKKNDVSSLLFEHLVNSEWREYDSASYAAGFLVLLYAILNCQHMYFRVNAAERGLQLKSVKGTLEAEANNDWEMQKLHIHFDGQLLNGAPAKDDEAYIVERMTHCPVSVNLKAAPDTRTTIRFI